MGSTTERAVVTYDQKTVREMVARFVEGRRLPRRINIITDTSDFFRVDYDDVVALNDHPYLIRNYEREGRFGIDEQPKFWVRRAIDLADGSLKIMKMVFHEKFRAHVGSIVFDCVRSPRKEARILDLVRGNPSFMQGFSVEDAAGNIVRVIDYIHGTTMDHYISGLKKEHEEYFYTDFPSLLDVFIELVRGIRYLHDQGEKHGDIRRDHIIRDGRAGQYCWIDFDFNYWHRENMYGYDLFGLGNIVVFLAGRGDHTIQGLAADDHPARSRLSNEDMNIFFRNRVVNLKKIFPYIPDELNNLLLHFSAGARAFYDDTSQLLDDLGEARSMLKSP